MVAVHTYVLLTKCEVMMAGYWPSSLLRFMDRDKVEIHKTAKENEANIHLS